MQEQRFGRIVITLIAVLALAFSLAIMGCDDDDEVNCEELAGLTFSFDASIIDPAFAGQTATLTFANNCVGDSVDFTLTIDGTVITGTATINSIEGEIETITVNGQSQTSIEIDGETFGIGDTVTIAEDVKVEEDENGQKTVTLTIDGEVVTFVFAPDETGSTGTTGSSGEES